MRPRLLWALAMLVLSACGDDDAVPPAGDGGNHDGAAIVDGPVGDAPPGDAGGQPLGAICVTGAPDGGFGACVEGAVCCSAGGSHRCTVPEDCPAGGAIQCTSSAAGQCPGNFICCQVDASKFCTKQSTCSQYGGTKVP